MIRREDVADLRAGDVVELRHRDWGEAAVRGSVREYLRMLVVGPVVVRHSWGHPPTDAGYEFTVVSRAPRPLYVNHPRTEPVPGDVVRDADDEQDVRTWRFDTYGVWLSPSGSRARVLDNIHNRLRLLVDGATGQVVP